MLDNFENTKMMWVRVKTRGIALKSNGYNRMDGIIRSGFYLLEGSKILADLRTAPFLNEYDMKSTNYHTS